MLWQVIRHPDPDDHLFERIIFWSHHEKIVVVDQTLAFFGGMQLSCFNTYIIVHLLLFSKQELTYILVVGIPMIIF